MTDQENQPRLQGEESVKMITKVLRDGSHRKR
jgi:hypothetical protein